MENLLQLAMQMILCLLIAAVIGAIIGYLLGRLGKCGPNEAPEERPADRLVGTADETEEKIRKHEKPASETAQTAFAIPQPKEEKRAPQQQEPQALQKNFDDIEGERPMMLAAPRNGIPDDLKEISGIGLKIEDALHELGIFHFDQIANWNEENIRWIDNYLVFKGRVNRENWVGQAKLLAAGRETDFSQRVKNARKKD